MTDENPEDSGAQATSGEPVLSVINQFILDFSFENIAAQKKITIEKQPEISISIKVEAERRSDNLYASTLYISAEAKIGEQPTYITELQYVGLFDIRNIPEESLQPVLLIECPRLIFPYARNIISGATRDGGFMPLSLDPFNFAALYQQSQQSAEAPEVMAPGSQPDDPPTA